MRPLSYPKLTPSHCLTQSFYLTPLDLRLLIYTRILVLLIPEVHSNRDTLWSVLDTYICESMNGETVETVSDFIWGGSKITGDGNCSHEIKRHLLPGRKAMTNLELYRKAETSLCQKRSFAKRIMVFPVVMYRCDSWTIKKAER